MEDGMSRTERYDERIAGILSCYDRVVITGTVPIICYAEGMTRFLYSKDIRIFDYATVAMTLRDRVRDRACLLASAAGMTIEPHSQRRDRHPCTQGVRKTAPAWRWSGMPNR
jgi:hypothetical protein